MRSIAAAAVAMGVALAAVLGFSSRAAYAQGPSEQGWWTATNPGVSSLGVNLPVQLPGQPDVPANGLLVEGGANQTSPVAYAGLVYQLPDGASATTLTLDVAAGSATTPNAVLQICPLNQATFNPEQGGPMSDAPAYTCTGQVTASPSSNGSSYHFKVASLVHQDTLAVAVLPTSPTDRVVLSQPDANSLGVRVQGSLGVQGGSATTGTDVSGGPNGSSVATGSPAPASQSLANLPSGSAVATPSLANPGKAAAQLQASVPAAISSAGGAAKPLAVALVILAALVGGAAWSGTGRAAVRAAANLSTNPRGSLR